MNINIQKLVLGGIADIFRPLTTVAQDRGSTVRLFQDLGWDIEALLGGDITPLTTILAALTSPLEVVEQLADSKVTASAASFSAFKDTLLKTKALGEAVKQLAALNLPGGLSNQFYTDVLQKMLTSYILSDYEKAYNFFVLAGIIVPDTISVQQSGRYVKYGSKVPLFSFTKLLA
jgi:hypothetical protein